jgi:hypothetical protein
MNQLIVSTVLGMPVGGSFSPSTTALAHLAAAIRVENGHLSLRPEEAEPTFCSAATYLVFVSVLDNLNRQDRLPLPADVMQALLVHGQPDGEGAWGRWNANGPGTARFFYELHLGKNFTSIDEAYPGDFLKIFWNENIGAHEFGHSVIYLGTGVSSDGSRYVRFWSGNKPAGYGIKTVPLTKVKQTLFSRLEYPDRIIYLTSIAKRDAYLAAMAKRSSTPEEMLQMVMSPPGSD